MSDDALIEAMARTTARAAAAASIHQPRLSRNSASSWAVRSVSEAAYIARADAQATVNTIWTDSDDVGRCFSCRTDVAREDVESYSLVHWEPGRGHALIAMYCAEHRPSRWTCPHCLDHFDTDDEDRPPVCDMCRKAGRA